MRIAGIMSGGAGQRFWPVSRTSKPKQLVRMVRGKSLLELTAERLRPLFDNERIWIVTQDKQLEETRRILQAHGGIKILAEPVGRNTAACTAYMASYARATAGDAVLVFLPADHIIGDAETFRGILSEGLEFVERTGQLLTIGIKADRPATGFGYIKRGEPVETAPGIEVFRVSQFVEKPSLDKAKRYLDSGDYLWNAGIFVFKASVILGEIQKYLPRMASQFEEFEKSVGTPNEESSLTECYSKIEEISIDHGVMERTDLACVVPTEIGWDDVGSWDSFSKYMDKDSLENAVKGQHVGLGTRNCIIYSDKQVVATAGVHDIILVATGDAILVSRRENEEEVKKLVSLLEEKGFTALL